MARLLLPLLGGGPSIWNTTQAFFQAALLAGYAYAHRLQRLPSVRAQAVTHVALAAAAALVLPLRVTSTLGAPSPFHPALWLIAALTLSVGAPFAILSATAPLIQAWRVRTSGHTADSAYSLYVASNAGSLAGLLAYPLLVEPRLTLHDQRLIWSGGYVGFAALIAILALAAARAASPPDAAPAPDVTPPAGAASAGWVRRLRWMALAALPSSLMLGVTTHLTTDVASAPFLWVVPLALYLVSFIIAFQARPWIGRDLTLVLQAGTVAACVATLAGQLSSLPAEAVLHLLAFLLTALVCHFALVDLRPAQDRLTEFYLFMSAGGMAGGMFNALAAPALFTDVLEYPVVLALAWLARPWGRGPIGARNLALLAAGLVLGLTPLLAHATAALTPGGGRATPSWVHLALAGATLAVFLLRSRAVASFAVLAAVSLGAQAAYGAGPATQQWRSFFGVMRRTVTAAPDLHGRVAILMHGTTLHGAQGLETPEPCRPLTYYGWDSPMGQVIRARQASGPHLRMGVVGLGAGALAAYVRPGDRMTFFEVDPLVVRIATDPRLFTYATRCAAGTVDYVVGDARQTLRAPAGGFDVLVIDAFSSDAVPAHLLTAEAIRDDLADLGPGGLLVLHLSNRHLDLMAPAEAGVIKAGAAGLARRGALQTGAGAWDTASDVVVASRRPEALAVLAGDPRWRPLSIRAAAWTDDYTDLPGAVWRAIRGPAAGP